MANADARSRCASGAATPAAARFKEYQRAAEEGMVVLDVIHRIQATQAGDLAVRWNCKAGKCGSCSAEINGKPRLMCMTRMNIFSRGRAHHGRADEDLPADQGPGHRRLVQLREGQDHPRLQAEAEGSGRHAPDVPGRRRPQSRSSASASSASCARTSATSSATTRRTSRPSPARASSCGWPRSRCTRWTRNDRLELIKQRRASATATSRSAAPKCAPSTSTSPTTRSSRSRSASSPSTTTRWSGPGGS